MRGDVSALVGSFEGDRRSQVKRMRSLTPSLASDSDESVSSISVACSNASASAIRAKEEDIATWTGSGEGGWEGEACYKEART
jgi:hypothetical protein